MGYPAHRFTTAPLVPLRRGGRLCPPKHRAAVSFRASPQTGVGIRPRRARRRETPKPPLCKGRWQREALTEGLSAQASCPVIPSQCSHWRGNPFPAPRRGVLLPPAAKVPKNAVQTCGLKIPYAPSPAAYHVKTNHANAVLCKFSLNLASSLLLFSLPLLL